MSGNPYLSAAKVYFPLRSLPFFRVLSHVSRLKQIGKPRHIRKDTSYSESCVIFGKIRNIRKVGIPIKLFSCYVLSMNQNRMCQTLANRRPQFFIRQFVSGTRPVSHCDTTCDLFCALRAFVVNNAWDAQKLFPFSPFRLFHFHSLGRAVSHFGTSVLRLLCAFVVKKSLGRAVSHYDTQQLFPFSPFPLFPFSLYPFSLSRLWDARCLLFCPVALS